MDNGGKDDKYYLHLIDESIDEMLEHLDGLTINDFRTNFFVMNAFSMAVQNIGENTNKLSSELKEKYAEVPWHAIVNIKRIQIHSDDSLEIEQLYNLVKNSIPEYSVQIKKIIKCEEAGICK